MLFHFCYILLFRQSNPSIPSEANHAMTKFEDSQSSQSTCLPGDVFHFEAQIDLLQSIEEQSGSVQ